jgi:2-desacetyl-2-hydroxyethyl bacteriochlorophyllide A dehydrogenase
MGGMVERTARAFWIAAPGRGEIRAEQLAEPTGDRVLIRARYSGISRGTESLVFEGRVPPSEYDRMRAPFQAGAFPAPVKYGYSSVGIVEAGADGLLGRHVFVLHPHQTRYIVPAAAAYVIPDGVPPGRAILAANLETAINILWDADVRLGDRVSVVGGGTVGLLVAWLAARVPGCDVQLVDVNPSRAEVAANLEVRFAAVESARREADLVVHTSGSPAGLAAALELAAFEAVIVDASWYGSDVVPLRLGEAFHVRRLTIRSSQVGSVAAAQRARWDSRRRMILALSLLIDPSLDALITSESDFESLPETMPKLARAPGDVICHRVRYE